MEPIANATEVRWRRMEELFHAAMAYPAAERVAKVREWSGGDATLVAQLLAMLESDSAVEEKLATGASLTEDGVLQRGDGAEAWVGRRLGFFELERVLGRGGMGVVFLGRRVEGFVQAAAVKVMGRHLRASPAVSQFLRERETLAQLEHGNIARLLDGGVEDGTPYVVMEYVEGRRLDEVCDDAAVTLEEKLRLMLQLCEAVGYVHRNLILHRDLKPGNVMVTAEGVVKLLDFGTFKLLGAAEQDSAMTQAGMRAVTLRYASPEHIEGVAVSTAADVYSLGMVLYRMVAGRLPDGLDGLPVGQYLERLREENFAAPSAVRGLAGRLAGDVDAIVLKAVRYEAGARYGNVSALAEDIGRALEDRPVAARAGSRRYRVGKFYRRHRVALVGSAAVLLVLVGGVAAMVRQGQVARAEQRRAEAGVEEERKLAHLLLTGYFEQLKEIPGSTTAQRKAVTQAIVYLDDLNRVTDSPKLELDSVQAYTQMGALLGSPYQENLGDEPNAMKTLDKAIALSAKLVAGDATNLVYLQAAAAANLVMGQVYLGAGEPKMALEYLKPAAETSRKIAASSGVDAAMLAQAGRVLNTNGDVYGNTGKASLGDVATAIQSYQDSREFYGRSLKMNPACANCRRGVAIALWQLGMREADVDQDKAAALLSEGLKVLSGFSPEEQKSARVLRADDPLRQRLAQIYIRTGRVAEGLAMFDTVHQRMQKAVARDPEDGRALFDLVTFDISMAKGYHLLGRLPEELTVSQEMLDSMNALVKKDPRSMNWKAFHAQALLRVGAASAAVGKVAEGNRLIDAGVAEMVPLAEKPDAEEYVLSMAAEHLNAVHRDAAEALAFAQRAAAPMKSPDTYILVNLAVAQKNAGLTEEAKKTAQRVLEQIAKHPNASGNPEMAAQARVLLQS